MIRLENQEKIKITQGKYNKERIRYTYVYYKDLCVIFIFNFIKDICKSNLFSMWFRGLCSKFNNTILLKENSL